MAFTLTPPAPPVLLTGSSMPMTSSRPYLMRALYEWIVDNGCTPYVVVNASRDDVQVPQSYVKDSQIVLNVAPSAVMAFHLDNTAMQFNARFGGVSMQIYVPMSAVLGIYARENGQGMVFEVEENTPPELPPTDAGPIAISAKTKKPGKPGLKIVK
jgi:stringent starvation protein B